MLLVFLKQFYLIFKDIHCSLSKVFCFLFKHHLDFIFILLLLSKHVCIVPSFLNDSFGWHLLFPLWRYSSSFLLASIFALENSDVLLFLHKKKKIFSL